MGEQLPGGTVQWSLSPDRAAEVAIARAFHEQYERLAPRFNYKTRAASAVPWDKMPPSNRGLMVAVVRALVENGVIALPHTGRGQGGENERP